MVAISVFRTLSEIQQINYKTSCVDLSALNLPCELSTICCKSTLSWKALVKRQVNIFEFKELSNLMSNMSKLKELTYKELKMQNYMLEFDSKLAKLILRYRIRMSNYSGNFKGKGQVKKCPVCKLHGDHQHLAFQCKYQTDFFTVKEVTSQNTK